ncbi:hypothetical protein [Azospirillum endophyticum]
MPRLAPRGGGRLAVGRKCHAFPPLVGPMTAIPSAIPPRRPILSLPAAGGDAAHGSRKGRA